MKALCWHSAQDVCSDEVPDPCIVDPRDAVVRVTAICGSDLHRFNGVIPSTEAGDVLGHEFMGKIVALGRDVRNLDVGSQFTTAKMNAP